MSMEELKKLKKLSRRSKLKTIVMASNTLKALSLNSRGYAARRTYGNRTTVRGMHADGVPQQRGWATPSGSMSRVMHFDSVGSANPRLLRGDRVAVIYADNIGTDMGDRVAVIGAGTICPETFPTTQHHK